MQFYSNGTIYTECLSIRPRQAFAYLSADSANPTRSRSVLAKSTKEKKREADRRRRQRLRQAIYLLVDSAKTKRVWSSKFKKFFSFKVNFVTLTIPNWSGLSNNKIHSDVFQPFLRRLKSKKKGIMWVWRAELQKNGTIHYHMVTNSFIHHKTLRNMWNYSIYMAGCTNIGDANSTDVHSLRGITDEAAYIVKYMSKSTQSTDDSDSNHSGRNDGDRLPEWGASSVLKKPISLKIAEPSMIIKQELRSLHFSYKKAIKTDHGYLFLWRKKWLKNCPNLLNIYNTMLRELVRANELIDSNNMILD